MEEKKTLQAETVLELIKDEYEQIGKFDWDLEYDRETDEYFFFVKDHSVYSSDEYMEFVMDLKIRYIFANGISNIFFVCNEPHKEETSKITKTPFSKAYRKLFIEYDLEPKEFMKFAGIKSPSIISYFETGKRKPTLKYVLSIFDFLQKHASKSELEELFLVLRKSEGEF